MLKRTGFFYTLLLLSAELMGQAPGDRVNTVFNDEFGCQWFGTDKGLLRRCGNTWNAYPVQSGYPGIVNDIKCKTSSSGSVLWVGTMNGIIRLSYNANSVVSASCFSSATNSFLSDTIRKITLDKYASIFFATPAGIGLFADMTWKFISKITDVFENRITSTMASGDTIFFGTTGEGVARLVRSADGYSGATSFVAPWSGLAGDNITCVFIDSKGHQWYGTDKGLTSHSKIDAKEGWNESFTEKLPDKYVSSIAEDKSGNIWVGTHGGLVRFAAGKPEITVWTKDNGLPSLNINDICFAGDGTLWIGTDKGASHFDGSVFKNIKTSEFATNFPIFNQFIK